MTVLAEMIFVVVVVFLYSVPRSGIYYRFAHNKYFIIIIIIKAITQNKQKKTKTTTSTRTIYFAFRQANRQACIQTLKQTDRQKTPVPDT